MSSERTPARRKLASATAASSRRRTTPVSILLTAAALSGATSIVSIRLASPFTLDEPLTVLLLFFLLPAIVIVLSGLRYRLPGLTIAVMQPVSWLAIVRGTGDPLALWLLPVGCAFAVVALARTGRVRAGRLVPSVVVVASVATVLLTFMPVAPAAGTRAVLIGVDGASWQCVDAAIEGRHMPNFERLLEDGHRAKLRSLPSMFSPQVWSAIATGCTPEVSGVYGWTSSQSTFRVGRFWDRMWVDGRSVGTCGWYFTWPPPDALSPRDFVTPSTLAPDSRAFPSECAFFWELWGLESGRHASSVPYGSVVGALRCGVRLSTLRRALGVLLAGQSDDPLAIDQTWRKRKLSASIQTDMFCELLRSRQPELGVVLLNQVDKVSHLYWKYRHPEEFPDVAPEDAARFGRAIEYLYAEADRCVGKIIEAIPPDAHVMIVSDHGFRPALRKVMGRFCRIRTENLLDALGVQDRVVGSNLDRKVYLEMTATDDNERRELRERLAQVLSSAHIRGEKRGFFVVAQEGDLLLLEIASRNAVPAAALIVVNGREYPLHTLVVVREEARFSGEHAPDGVYLLAGPRAPSATQTDSLHVLDVAPTMAAILDLPMSPLWTGRPAFEPASLGDVRYAEYAPPDAVAETRRPSADDALKKALRSLGYLE